MEQWNLDDGAFDDPIDGVIRPENIPWLQVYVENAEDGAIPLENIPRLQVDVGNAEEENADVNPQIFLPLPVVLQERGEQAAAPDTEDTSLDLVMAHATDLQTFREHEGYRFGRDCSDSDSDIPEDYSSEDEA